MTTPVGVRAACSAALAAAAGLALPTLAEAPAASRPCRSAPCSATIVVTPRGEAFSSEQTFRPREEEVQVRLLAGGRELHRVDGERGSCRTRLRGPGVIASVAVCGTTTSIEVRARRTWGGSSALQIRYGARPRVPQGVLGVQGGSDGGSGGVGPPNSGGVGNP